MKKFTICLRCTQPVSLTFNPQMFNLPSVTTANSNLKQSGYVFFFLSNCFGDREIKSIIILTDTTFTFFLIKKSFFSLSHILGLGLGDHL